MIGEAYPGEFEAMEHNGRLDAIESEKPHWIKARPGQKRGAKFYCSKCHDSCVCLHYGANKATNRCDYKYCPRCGEEMDISYATRLVVTEVVEEQA